MRENERAQENSSELSAGGTEEMISTAQNRWKLPHTSEKNQKLVSMLGREAAAKTGEAR